MWKCEKLPGKEAAKCPIKTEKKTLDNSLCK